jgi:hypothetical protein
MTQARDERTSSETCYLLILLGIRKKCLDDARSLLVCLFIKRAIKVTVVIGCSYLLKVKQCCYRPGVAKRVPGS